MPRRKRKEEKVLDIKKDETYDELYPDEPKTEEKKETIKEIIKETEGVIPRSPDRKQDIINRLNGIQNIALEWNRGKYKKLIKLSNECKTLLDEL